MKQPKVLIVGSINMDMIFYGPHGDEMKPNGCLNFDSIGYYCGGKGANQAMAAAKLGAEAYLVSAVGSDENGRKIRELLRGENVHLDFISVLDDVQTGLSGIFMMKDGSYIGTNIRGANDRIMPEMVEHALDAEAFDMVLMQMEMPLETVYRTYELATERKIPVILDAGPAMKIPLERLRGIFMVSPNEAETEALTGIAVKDEETALEAAKFIREHACAKYVLLKLGGKGSYLYDGKKGSLYPACKVNFVDTTGAGDTFTTALMIRLCNEDGMETAIRYATAAAGICVSRRGGISSIPDREEIELQIKNMSDQKGEQDEEFKG